MLGDSLRRRHGADKRQPPEREERPSRPPPSGDRFRLSWWKLILAAVVVLAGSFAVGYLLSTQVLFPRPETAGAGIAVPSLYGATLAEAEAAIREAGLVRGEITEVASGDTRVGRVLAQEPVPGQQLRRGAAVSFAVSSGPPELRVPPVQGMDVETARELLEALGFAVDVQEVHAAGVPPGTVTRMDPDPGVQMTLPGTVTLRVNAAPMADVVNDTLDVTP